MKRCKHSVTVGYMWRMNYSLNEMQWQHAFAQPGRIPHHDRITCTSCGAWLSLGIRAEASLVAFRVRREWFAPNPWLLNLIALLQQELRHNLWKMLHGLVPFKDVA